MSEHDTYVYKDGYRYAWTCMTCGAESPKPHKRRMDADDEANTHEETA